MPFFLRGGGKAGSADFFLSFLGGALPKKARPLAKPTKSGRALLGTSETTGSSSVSLGFHLPFPTRICPSCNFWPCFPPHTHPKQGIGLLRPSSFSFPASWCSQKPASNPGNACRKMSGLGPANVYRSHKAFALHAVVKQLDFNNFHWLSRLQNETCFQ